VEQNKHVTYISYLKIDELLALQQPLSDGPEHDELLFITIHQVYELWFKQVLHEVAALQVTLEAGNSHRSMALLGRIRTIMKTCVSQLDILETMTPLQFNSFRERLSSASGFHSSASLRPCWGDGIRLGQKLMPNRAWGWPSTSLPAPPLEQK
jgi:tryptophan 2,3-dioxygenase